MVGPPPDSRDGPEVSVIIPTHDRADLLPTALACALGQEDVEVEVIVVDDGSSDATPQLLAELDDPRLTVLRNETARGVSAARNRGIEHARAPWIAFLDDDDLWAPEKLRTQLEAARDSNAVLVYSRAVAVDSQRHVRRLLNAPSAKAIATQLVDGNVIGSPSTVMARATALRAVGGFDERMSILADWDLWLRLARAGEAAMCPQPHVAYTEHGHNMHRDIDAMMDEFRQLDRKHRPSVGRRLGGEWWWRWIASIYRRGGRRVRAARTYLYCAVRFRDARGLSVAVGILVGERRLALQDDFPDQPAADEPAWLEAHR